MSDSARCSHCGEPLVVVLQQDDKPVLDRLDRIEQTLGGIQREMRKDVSEIDDKLNAEDTALTGLEADETRELADLQALKDQGQTLTPEQEQRFDALTARISADDAAIDTADPATPVNGVPVDGDASTPVAE